MYSFVYYVLFCYSSAQVDVVHASHVDVAGAGGLDSPLPAAVTALAAAGGGGTPGVASPGVDFQKVLHQRKLMEEAVKIWKEKPKNAVKFLVQRGFLEMSASAIAAFITRYCQDLDKTQTGDYLGEGKDFNIAILHAFVDTNQFTGIDFIAALRGFLGQFRLPGEAQKIDRIMEKFAERFCLDNPNVFRNADAAFVLVYSIIMLNTDLHNSSIKEEKKISLEEYIRNCRGINDGEDFDPAFLKNIYGQIKADQISLKEDDDLRDAEATKKTGGGLFGKSEARLRRELFVRDREDLKRETQLALQRGRGSDEPYLTADLALAGEVQVRCRARGARLFSALCARAARHPRHLRHLRRPRALFSRRRMCSRCPFSPPALHLPVLSSFRLGASLVLSVAHLVVFSLRLSPRSLTTQCTTATTRNSPCSPSSGVRYSTSSPRC